MNLRGFNQTKNIPRGFGRFRRATEEPIFPANSKGLHAALRCIVINIQTPIVNVSTDDNPVFYGRGNPYQESVQLEFCPH